MIPSVTEKCCEMKEDGEGAWRNGGILIEGQRLRANVPCESCVLSETRVES